MNIRPTTYYEEKQAAEKLIKRLDIEIACYDDARLNSTNDHTKFMFLNHEYQKLVGRKAIAQTKIKNIKGGKPANGRLESYENSVQLPRAR
jgi:hypothetical protein